MTRRDDHIQDDHFQSAHSEKKEWVTPKISPLMGAVDTQGKTTPFVLENTVGGLAYGPS